jgi:biotin operon repressor/transposase-like protein
MGWFKKKEKPELRSEVAQAFSRIKEDTSLLYKWISWLKTNHDMLHDRHHDHRRVSEERHITLRREVALLQKENERLSDSIVHLYDYIKTLHGEFKQLHGRVEELTSEPEQEELTEDFAHLVEEPEPAGAIEHQPINSGGLLTSAEGQLVGVLAAGEPLSYTELSKALGLSYGTVKNRVNHIKSKGIRVEFAVDKKGERRFFLPQTELLRLSGR